MITKTSSSLLNYYLGQQPAYVINPLFSFLFSLFFPLFSSSLLFLSPSSLLLLFSSSSSLLLPQISLVELLTHLLYSHPYHRQLLFNWVSTLLLPTLPFYYRTRPLTILLRTVSRPPVHYTYACISTYQPLFISVPTSV